MPIGERTHHHSSSSSSSSLIIIIIIIREDFPTKNLNPIPYLPIHTLSHPIIYNFPATFIHLSITIPIHLHTSTYIYTSIHLRTYIHNFIKKNHIHTYILSGNVFFFFKSLYIYIEPPYNIQFSSYIYTSITIPIHIYIHLYIYVHLYRGTLYIISKKFIHTYSPAMSSSSSSSSSNHPHQRARGVVGEVIDNDPLLTFGLMESSPALQWIPPFERK